jgi:hypothetical protein
MAKVAIKYDNIVPYGGIFYAMNEFKRTGLDKLVDGRLNVRCANYGYQYSDIMLALFCIYLCGGDHIEDITTILNKYLSTAPDARIPSSDTIARGLKELRALSIAYTSKTGSIYAHDPAMKLNSLLLDMTLLLGLLKRGQGIDVDFDNEFIPTEKSDALYSYKKKRGYFPGVMTSGPLIIGIENRQGNSNVKFEQVEELSTYAGQYRVSRTLRAHVPCRLRLVHQGTCRGAFPADRDVLPPRQQLCRPQTDV